MKRSSLFTFLLFFNTAVSAMDIESQSDSSSLEKLSKKRVAANLEKAYNKGERMVICCFCLCILGLGAIMAALKISGKSIDTHHNSTSFNNTINYTYPS